jgi:2,4-dienoyl-CoA reductase-like NADH-dependent reductase (Old Yellow Enzyme family)
MPRHADINSGESEGAAIDAQRVDAVAFGRLFLANADLPRRFAKRASLNTPDLTTAYSEGETEAILITRR